MGGACGIEECAEMGAIGLAAVWGLNGGGRAAGRRSGGIAGVV